ncbi:MAG: DNA alkylation repair protein [Candidatus Humimicrobiaceae bacterium]
MPSDDVKKLKEEVSNLGSPQKAKSSEWFFKTGKGEYAEGDKFAGLTTPESKAIAKKYADLLDVEDLKELLISDIHEERIIAIILLKEKYKKGDEKIKKKIFDIYISNTGHINNWDIVDISAEYIVGDYLENKEKDILFDFSRSALIWERRISIMSTFGYIKKGKPELTLKLAEILLDDKQDLIHKAVGWMLREIGKRCSQKILEEFLKKHYERIPRTALRYAIEKFPEPLRRKYLKGDFLGI